MGERAAALAREFGQKDDALIATVEQCPDARWSATCPDTGWSTNVQAHHIAAVQAMVLPAMETIAKGEQFTAVDTAMIDRMNAKHAQEYASASKNDVAAALRANGAKVAEWIQGLSEEQLDRTATFVTGMQPTSVEQLIQYLFLGEIERHGGNLRQAIGASGA